MQRLPSRLQRSFNILAAIVDADFAGFAGKAPPCKIRIKYVEF